MTHYNAFIIHGKTQIHTTLSEVSYFNWWSKSGGAKFQFFTNFPLISLFNFGQFCVLMKVKNAIKKFNYYEMLNLVI